jgi:hypothetical protein
MALPACFDLQQVDPGPRFIDDFEGDGGLPTWNRFGAWSCRTFTGSGDPGAPPDAGAKADGGEPGEPDAGQCHLAVQMPGDGDKRALRTDFELTDPPDSIRQFPAAEVVTRTTGGTVDVSGFAQLVFSAILESAPLPITPLPSGTRFVVELGCSTFTGDPIATQTVALTLGADWTELRLKLSDFTLKNMTRPQPCLALVDSIHFEVVPGLADGMSTGGSLFIDNISLQN